MRAAAAGSAGAARERRHWTVRSGAARLGLGCLAAGLALGAALSLAWNLVLAGLVAAAPMTYDLVIPPGTADLVAQGAAPPSIPTSLALQEGDSLMVINEDSVRHVVGSFAIDPGQSRQFPLAAFVSGGSSSVFLCSFHPGNALQLTMKDRAGGPSMALMTVTVGLPLALGAFAVLSVTSKL